MIINGDTIEEMNKLEEKSINLVITSPPYNKSRKGGKTEDYTAMYKNYSDSMNYDDYMEWLMNIFKCYDRILAKNGVILFNINYSTDKKTNIAPFELIVRLEKESNFTLADNICWKKSNALPNNVSNKLTRIWENVLVFVRKEDYKTFNINKKVKSISRTGQKYYEGMLNFITAKNNDGVNKLNKATFSTDLVNQLLDMYYVGGVVLDNFNGTGTTTKACYDRGIECIGIEKDEEQCEFAKMRLEG